MSATKKSKKLTNDQLQTILNTDHIRQHLIKAGLINHRGNIIRKDGSRRRHVSNKYPKSVHRPLLTASPTRQMENIITKPKRQVEFRSPVYTSTDWQLKSAATTDSKQTNKTQPSTRVSTSSKQSQSVQNVLLRRAVSPKITPDEDRCRVTLVYYGPEINIEYDREWFEPDGDEIMIMQQHCGGENLIVYKGSLQPGDQFIFDSRRHADFPFALAFYVNGRIDNRLSICCESRCNGSMRIGGKRGLFLITNVEKPKPCRRCRFEQRMKKLIESEPKSSESLQTTADQRGFRSPRTTRSSRLKAAATRSNNSVSPAKSPKSTTEPDEVRKSTPEPMSTDTTNSKSAATRTSSSDSSVAPMESSKTVVDRSPSPEANGSRTSTKNSDASSLESDTVRPSSSKRSRAPATIPDRSSSPESDISDTSSPRPIKNSNKRHDSAPPLSVPSTNMSNHQKQSRPTNSPNVYIPDFEEPEEEIHSSVSTPRENGRTQAPTTEINSNQERRPSIVSTDEDRDAEVLSITDESDAGFEEVLARANRRRSSDD